MTPHFPPVVLSKLPVDGRTAVGVDYRDDADYTISPETAKPTQVYRTPLSADRFLTLLQAHVHATFVVLRQDTAKHDLEVSYLGTALQVVPARGWAIFQFDGDRWVVISGGSLDAAEPVVATDISGVEAELCDLRLKFSLLVTMFALYGFDLPCELQTEIL